MRRPGRFSDLRIRYKLLISYSAVFILALAVGSAVIYAALATLIGAAGIQVGTNLSTATTFPVIEKWLGKPALPINIATAWHALRSCGVLDQYDHLGRLFEEH